MKLECKVFGETWPDGEDKIYFDLDIGGETRKGYISGEAIRALQVPYTEDWATVFEQYRNKIQKMAHDHWRKNPMNQIIVLDAGDL